ncbi:MAG: 5'-3' exonuclease H3TH domain-containing protein [Planctomycetota bacterium]
MKLDPVYLIDGHALIFRAHFGARAGNGRRAVSQGAARASDPPPDTAPPDARRAPGPSPEGTLVRGGSCEAIEGFLSSLVRFLAAHSPRFVAIALDGPSTGSFRRTLHPEYKAHRRAPDEALRLEFPWCEQGARALGFPIYRQAGFEADDLIASIATRLAAPGRRVVIVSPDKDLSQLVSAGVVQWDAVRPERLIDAAAVERRWGVRPAQLPDLLGLAGDPTDNIPGVPGIGLKTGAALLRAYGTLEAIPSDPKRARELSPRRRLRAATLLRENWERALRSRELARLRKDLEVDAADLAWRGVDMGACRALCDHLGLDRLRCRIGRLVLSGKLPMPQGLSDERGARVSDDCT